MNSDSAVPRYPNNGHHPYSTPGYGQTRDTVNTGGSNGSASDQWHNSTDPSSDNSSIERVKAEGHNAEFGYPTSQREPISEDGHYTYNNGGGYNPAYMSGAGRPNTPGAIMAQQLNGAPAPPPKSYGGPVQAPHATLRQVIKLDNSGSATGLGGRPSLGDTKRKSWLKRTFSKNKA
jgi:hypothetical protein